MNLGMDGLGPSRQYPCQLSSCCFMHELSDPTGKSTCHLEVLLVCCWLTTLDAFAVCMSSFPWRCANRG